MTSAATLTVVPFVDLTGTHDAVKGDLDQLWREITSTNRFIGGAVVERFEAEFASFCRSDHCVGVGNGTDAIELILTAMGIGRGAEVVVPANTFVATPEAVVRAGAVPVFADVDPETLLLTDQTLADAITPATAAVVVVHLYGQTPDMDAITTTAARFGIAVVEDAAQAHGAAWRGRRAGSWGHAAAFSFYPTKNLGAFGDGGAVVTSDPTLTATVRCLADHGRLEGSHHHHAPAGRNTRLDALQAGVLSVKLRQLDRCNEARRRASSWYRARLRGTACEPVAVNEAATAVHHLEVVRVPDRDAVVTELSQQGIGWGLHYPVPCHRQPAFAHYATPPLPVVERVANDVLSMPMYPSITEHQVERVCEVLASAVEEGP